MTPPIDQQRQRLSSKSIGSLFSLFSLFCILFSFASINNEFTVASHNLHSFKKSSIFHKQCIQTNPGLWFAQELWLPENRLTNMSELGVQFVARSGMEDAYSSGIYSGRPHGGVSIAWSPEMDYIVKPLINNCHKRVVCVEITAKPTNILFANVYMPFYDTSRRQECMADSLEVITMLEEILVDHPLHRLVLGGDFNTEFTDSSPLDHLWRDFIKQHNLVCCDKYNNNNRPYTYIHNSLNQKKWNDHFFISSSLVQSSVSHMIVDVGDNPSDHLPISLRLSVETTAAPVQDESITRVPIAEQYNQL